MIVSNLPALEVLNCAWCCEGTPEEVITLIARAKKMKNLILTPRPYDITSLWAIIVQENKQIDFCDEVLHLVPPSLRPYGHNIALPSIMDNLW